MSARAPGIRLLSTASVVLLGFSACAASDTEAPPAPPTSVLMVVLDAVRADALATFGATRPTSPQLDLLAETGVVFEQAYMSSTWSWPGHASLFTGLPPWEHGAHGRREADNNSGQQPISALRDDVSTLAERFGTRGYHTVLFSENAWLDPGLGLSRGFETVDLSKKGCPANMERFGQEISGVGDQPVFAFVNFMQAHAPYYVSPAPWLDGEAERFRSAPMPSLENFIRAEPPAIEMYASRDDTTSLQTAVLSGERSLSEPEVALLRRVYEGQVLAADFCLSKAISAWIAHRPDGIVVVTSDHGESFGEHGMIEHAHVPFLPVLHVPLVVVQPGIQAQGIRVTSPVSTDAVAGTILDLAGVTGHGLTSLVPMFHGGTAPSTLAASYWPDPTAARLGPRFSSVSRYLQKDGWAAVWSDHEQHLFNTHVDPSQQVDVASEHKPILAALIAEGEALMVEEKPTAAVKIVDQAVLEQLKALGYVEG